MNGLILLAPGTLAAATRERTRGALASGALLPIATRQCLHDAGAMRFVVRTMSSLARRDESRSAAEASPGPRRNPFLPYEDALYVAAITPTHVALLNKFPVQDDHLLIVTRAFAPQEALLDADDFLALAACLAEVDGLAFYNAGEVAGASQPHKHLQLVPLPLAERPCGSADRGRAGADPRPIARRPSAGPAVPLRVRSIRSRSAARSAIRRAGARPLLPRAPGGRRDRRAHDRRRRAPGHALQPARHATVAAGRAPHPRVLRIDFIERTRVRRCAVRPQRGGTRTPAARRADDRAAGGRRSGHRGSESAA